VNVDCARSRVLVAPSPACTERSDPVTVPPAHALRSMVALRALRALQAIPVTP